MFRFEYPIYLYLLIIIPLLELVYYIAQQRKKRILKRLGDIDILKNMMENKSSLRSIIKFQLLILAIILFILMLAKPQTGAKISNEKRKGIEAMIAFDISNSMLAEDVVPSRLDKSKLLLEGIIDKFNDDKVGLVVYAGDAFVQLPMTNDFISAKMFLQDINPSLIRMQGTNIAEAINISINCFTKNKSGKAIIIITDGEDHEGQTIEAAKNAADKGVNVFVLGVGTKQGGKIPLVDGNYLKDENGNDVVSVLNEDMCQQIASAGKGQYIRVDNTNKAQKILEEELAKMQKGESSTIVYSSYNNHFQAIALLIILILIIDACILERRNKRFKKINIFNKATKGNKIK